MCCAEISLIGSWLSMLTIGLLSMYPVESNRSGVAAMNTSRLLFGVP